jgi:predicted porin
MKKLALLIALLASVGLAQAEVSLFGTMDAGYSSSKAPGVQTLSTNTTSGGMTTSFWGLKGGEDLGNGRKAVFEVSSFLNTENGATLGGSTVNTFARSSFVGLSDKTLGSLTLGRQSNPSFLPTILFNAYGDSGAYSPLWHATYFGNTGNPTTQLYNDTAWDNAATYTSPNLHGATVSLTGSQGTMGNNSGGNVLFFKGNLGLTAYWQSTKTNSTGSFQTNIFTNGKAAEAKGVGASYDLKVAKIMATWQDAKDAALNMEGKTTQVSALVPVGQGNIMAEYADSKFVQGLTTKYKESAVGYDYKFSKTVDAYATVGRTSVTSLASGQTYGAGVRVRF